jgi:hypothetical protein
MSEVHHNTRLYVFLILGLALVAAIFTYLITGGELPGMANSPTAEISGKTAQ